MPACPDPPIKDIAPRCHRHPCWPQFLHVLQLAALFVLILAPLAWGASGSLRVIDSSSEPTSLHPHRSFDQYSDVIISQIYEGLVDFDFNGRLVPRLAIRWQIISPTRFRFWLRKGVRFHNGETFDARAVKFSVEHQMRRQSLASNAMLFDSGMHVEVIDKYTVDLVTTRPDARLPSSLPMFLCILPPLYLAEVGDDGLELHPNGTGPYRYLDRTPGHSIRLTANKDYWQPDLPRIKDVAFFFVPRKQQFDALMRGQADLVTKLRGTDSLAVMTSPNTRVTKREEAVALWISLKNYDSPFADRRVRLAVSYAVNREHLIKYVDKGSSHGISTSSRSVEQGYNTALHPYPFDLAKARQLLAEAGYAKGFKAKVLASDDTADIIHALKPQLKMIGVELNVTIVPWDQFLKLTMVSKSESDKPARAWDMTAWITANPTLNAFFIPMVLFYSRSPYSIMYDPAFDKIYLDYVTEVSSDLRREKLDMLQARALNEAYGIYIAQRVQIYGLHWDLHIENHPTGMLTGRTLAEAFWKERPGSLWDESTPSKKRNIRGGHETGHNR